jgi:predicted XRE-type DNA-binding protein
MKRPPVTKGSGNIFRDLGFSEERSAELILKSSLLQALQETIRSHVWTQTEAAARLGIDQGAFLRNSRRNDRIVQDLERVRKCRSAQATACGILALCHREGSNGKGFGVKA